MSTCLTYTGGTSQWRRCRERLASPLRRFLPYDHPPDAVEDDALPLRGHENNRIRLSSGHGCGRREVLKLPVTPATHHLQNILPVLVSNLDREPVVARKKLFGLSLSIPVQRN